MSIARAVAGADARRYARSPWVWLLMMAGPVFARVWIPGAGDSTSVIVVNDAAPVLTSSTLGLSLGVVVSALLLPLCYIFLRAGPTRNQPWQVQDVTPAHRVPIAVGHWLADVGLFCLVLFGLGAAGILLAYLMLPAGHVSVLEILAPLWLTALPSLALMAGVRSLFAARRFSRGGWGDFGFFLFWMAGIIAGGILVSDNHQSAFFDYSGAFGPIAANVTGDTISVGIGASPVQGKTIALNVLTPMLQVEYLAARLFWLLIGLALAALGGLIYQTPVQARKRGPRWFERFLAPVAKTVTVDRLAPPAPLSSHPWLGLLVTQAHGILRSHAGVGLAIILAGAGLILPFRQIISPAALLMLIIGSTAHLARTDARGMTGLLRTMAVQPWQRRLFAGIAIIGLAVGMALPAQLVAPLDHKCPLLLAVATGFFVALVAIGLGAATRSAFAGRLLLLICWYGYISV